MNKGRNHRGHRGGAGLGEFLRESDYDVVKKNYSISLSVSPNFLTAQARCLCYEITIDSWLVVFAMLPKAW